MRNISTKNDESNKSTIRRIDNSLFHQVIGLCWDKNETQVLLSQGTPHERALYLRGVRMMTAAVIVMIGFVVYLAWPSA